MIANKTEAPRAAKPPVVWLTQGVCALVAASCLYFARLMEDSTSSTIIAALGLFYLALLIAIQLRQPWARWVVLFFFGSTALGALMQGLGALSRRTEDTTLLVSSALTFLVCAVIAVHFIFGEPVKRFFRSKSPALQRQAPSPDSPEAAPDD